MSKTVQVLLILFLVELFGGFMSNLFVGGSASLFLIIIGVFIFLQFVPVGLWISAISAGVSISIFNLVGMRLRRVPPDKIVLPLIKANKAGLHARPATFFIQKANEYKATIWVEKEERRVNAKSLLGVLSLGIIGGTTIKIIADGADETDAVEGLAALVESGFAE